MVLAPEMLVSEILPHVFSEVMAQRLEREAGPLGIAGGYILGESVEHRVQLAVQVHQNPVLRSLFAEVEHGKFWGECCVESTQCTCRPLWQKFCGGLGPCETAEKRGILPHFVSPHAVLCKDES